MSRYIIHFIVNAATRIIMCKITNHTKGNKNSVIDYLKPFNTFYCVISDKGRI